MPLENCVVCCWCIVILLAVAHCYVASGGTYQHDETLEFMEWLSKHPGFASKVNIGVNSKGIRGIYAATDISEVCPVFLTASATSCIAVAVVSI